MSTIKTECLRYNVIQKLSDMIRGRSARKKKLGCTKAGFGSILVGADRPQLFLDLKAQICLQ